MTLNIEPGGSWYFYSPLLEFSGGLPAKKEYADSHFFRHFQDDNKYLGTGTGFWVNTPKNGVLANEEGSIYGHSRRGRAPF